jgi:hypothetical protein
MMAGIRVDDDLLDADEPFIVGNPIFDNKSQKFSILFAGSRSIAFKSYIMRSKRCYMLRNVVENVLLGYRTAFSYFYTGCTRQV